MKLRGAKRHVLAALLFLGGLAAWRFAGYAGEDRLGEIAVWAIFAMSLDLLVGYTGMVSLGHALFYGIAAYSLAALTQFLAWPPLAGILAGIALAAVAAAILGFIVVRISGVFFIMITLALGQMGWAYVLRTRTFGGFGGLSGVPQIDLSAIGLQLMNPSDFALFAVIVAGIVYVGLAFLVASPFGHMLVAMHQNENRARALGLPVFRYKLAIFIVAGAVAGLAGTLAAQRTQLVSPDSLVWTTSGDVLVMAILGGLGTLSGPVAGAALWVVLRDWISSYTPYWMLAMGVFFIAVVLFADNGLYGLLKFRWTRLMADDA
jgi:branched-chain amino acid transport system permease protein